LGARRGRGSGSWKKAAGWLLVGLDPLPPGEGGRKALVPTSGGDGMSGPRKGDRGQTPLGGPASPKGDSILQWGKKSELSTIMNIVQSSQENHLNAGPGKNV